MSSEAVGRLAVAQAVYKAVAGAVKTKDPGNLRGEADAELARLYEESGCASVEMRVNGERVGRLSVKTEKAHAEVADPEGWRGYLGERARGGDPRVAASVWVDASALPPQVVDDVLASAPWAVRSEADGSKVLKALAADGDGAVFDPATGEPCPWAAWVPERPCGTVLTGCEPRAVAEALRTPQAVADALAPFMLGEGE